MSAGPNQSPERKSSAALLPTWKNRGKTGRLSFRMAMDVLAHLDHHRSAFEAVFTSILRLNLVLLIFCAGIIPDRSHRHRSGIGLIAKQHRIVVYSTLLLHKSLDHFGSQLRC